MKSLCLGKSNAAPYTVVGVYVASDASSLRNNSVVQVVRALTPAHASFLLVDKMCAEMGCTSEDVEILAVFHGAHQDLYIPDLLADEAYRKELDAEWNSGESDVDERDAE
jgi:hypothetical protein